MRYFMAASGAWFQESTYYRPIRKAGDLHPFRKEGVFPAYQCFFSCTGTFTIREAASTRFLESMTRT